MFVTPELANLTVDFAQPEKALSAILKPDLDLVKQCLQKHIYPHGCISRCEEIWHEAETAVSTGTYVRSTGNDICTRCTRTSGMQACTAENEVLQQRQTSVSAPHQFRAKMPNISPHCISKPRQYLSDRPWNQIQKGPENQEMKV